MHKIYNISIYNTSEYCFLRDLIGSSILRCQVIFTLQLREEKMACESHFIRK